MVTVAVVGGLYAAGRTIGNWIPGPGEWRTFPAVEGELEPGRYVIGDPFPIRIGLTVPAGWDAVPGGACKSGDAAHERAADAEDVNVHQAAVPKTVCETAIVAMAQVTAIAKPVTRPVSSAERRMCPMITRYQMTNSV